MNNQQRAANAIKWIDTLATTRRKQGKERLGDAQTGYCCLGVACKVLKVPYDSDEGTSEPLVNVVGLNDDSGSYVFKDGEKAPYQEAHGDVNIENLVGLNDGHNFTFKQIAERLRTKARRYFKGSVGSIVAKHYKDLAKAEQSA